MAFSFLSRRATGAVEAVMAHTLQEDNASVRVLIGLGFQREAELVDPEDGPSWRWRTVLLPSSPVGI